MAITTLDNAFKIITIQFWYGFWYIPSIKTVLKFWVQKQFIQKLLNFIWNNNNIIILVL